MVRLAQPERWVNRTTAESSSGCAREMTSEVTCFCSNSSTRRFGQEAVGLDCGSGSQMVGAHVGDVQSLRQGQEEQEIGVGLWAS